MTEHVQHLQAIHDFGDGVVTKVLNNIDDLDLQAFVDNQLSLPTEAQLLIQRAIQDDPKVRRRYEELQRQRQLLQQWWEENKRETLQ